MAGSSTISRVLFGALLFAGLSSSSISLAQAERSAPSSADQAAEPTNPGQFFQISEPITSETLEQTRLAARQFIERHAASGQRPVLVFEIRSGGTSPGSSDFFACYALASFLATKLEGAKRTVAYVPESLKRPVSLLPFACDEIVMGPEATLGPITPEDQEVDAAHRENVRILAERKGKDPNLLAGLLDRNMNLRVIETSDRQSHFVRPEQVDDFKANHTVLQDRSAWEGSSRGVLTARYARELGVAQLMSEKPSEVANAYHFGGQSTSNDPTLGQAIVPVWIPINGPIDHFNRRKISLRIEQAIQEKVNLIFFRFDCRGGKLEAADGLADLIAGLKQQKTVAYIEDQAVGVAALPALACSDIVFHKGAAFGEIAGPSGRRRGGFEPLEESDIEAVTRRAVQLAELKGHPAAVAAAMADPNAVLLEATDTKTGARALVLQSQVDAEPNRYINMVPRKIAGEILSVSSDEAIDFGLGRVVNETEDCKSLYGLRGITIREDGPGSVDSLVAILTDPIISWLLLFVGLFMLVLELKLPGIGLPAIVSCLSFMLFFWSRYLSGTADQLEIILFLVGMISLALELFVFPGFGVFGMSGVLLVLTSIVLASHTFVWPSHDYEYREMGYTLIQVLAAMVSVGLGAVGLARYFPSMPLFNRLVLKPEPWVGLAEESSDYETESRKPAFEGVESLAYLIGESGRTTTMLRPLGKARFGSLLIDVKTDGDFIEPDSLIEVIEVQGNRVIVRKLDI